MLQRRFITDQFVAMNNAVGNNDDALWSYIDLDDAARYYIVREIISDTESFHGSTYLFRDRGEGQKWHFSPIWDCGNAFNGPTDGFFFDHDPYGNTWIPSMAANPAFAAKVKETWIWFMQNRYPGLTDDIDTYADRITEAAKADHRRWNNQPVPDGGIEVQDNSDMPGRRNTVLTHLQAKTKWLETKWGHYATAPAAAEPARDSRPAAPLPPYLAAGIDNIVVDPAADAFADSSAKSRYFDLTGRPIAAPAPGHPAIERRGSSARLVITR